MTRINTQIEDAFPLSALQQGMIYHSLQDRSLSVYHDVITFPVYQCWQEDRFNNALAIMIKRHPALRTRFRMDKGRALQLVFTELSPVVSVVDVCHLDKQNQEQAISNWVQEEKQQGIELTKALWRICIMPCDANRFQFGLSMHHALMDGWSVAAFSNELFTLYQQLAGTEPLPLAAELPSYKLFIMQEQQAQKDETQRQYWLQHFSDARLPWWSGSKKTASVRFTCDVSTEQSQAAVALAARLGIQEKSLWCTVYLVLLSLLDGATDVVGSVVTHGRPEVAGAERMLGLFLNSLPVRTDMSGKSWNELLLQVDVMLRQQYSLRHFPLVNVQMLTQLDFSASMFNFMNFHVYNTTTGVASQVEAESQSPQLSGFDETNYLFSVNVQKQATTSRHLFVLNAEPTVFDEEFRQRICQYAGNIIRLMLTTPNDVPVRAALLGTQQCQLLLNDWNTTQLAYEARLGLHQLFEQQVTRSPEKPALVYQDTTLTYHVLNQKANQLTHRLIALGIQPEQRVGIYLPRDTTLIVAILAVLKSGACYVPIDPAYPASRVEYLLQDAELSCLLSISQLPATAMEVPRLNLDQHWPVTQDDNHNPQRPYDPAQLAYIIYTSGSTGMPKGVALAHRGMLSLLAWASQTLAAEDMRGVLASTSMCFDLSVYEFFLPLTTGNTCILIDNILLWAEQSSISPVPVTLINTVPSAARALLEQQFIPDSVRVINLAGEPLKSVLVEQLYSQTRVERVFDLYGPSEDTTYSTGKLRHRGAAETIGRPVANTQSYILDNQGQLCPPGVVGELYLSGDGLARGYLNRPALTAAHFLPNPYALTPGARMYRTGDLVRYSTVTNQHVIAGDLQYLGRIDHQIKLRGFRIELGEIESCLLSHPYVRDTVVIVHEQAGRGAQLVAYLVANDMAEAVSIDHIRQYVQERLPAHQVPAVFMLLPHLPLNPNGKVDRKALPAPGSSEVMVYGFTEPQGEIEQLLAGIWCGILQCGQVRRQQTFISLGGNSLHISRLSLRIREVFAVSIPLSQLFVLQTVQAQAQEISRLHRSTPVEIELLKPIPPGQRVPLTYNQQSLYFLHQHMEPGVTYNLPLAIVLRGSLEIADLQAALQDLLHRHQALRTRFYVSEDQVFQQADDTETFLLPVIQADSSLNLADICQQQLHYIFNLDEDALLRVLLVRENSDSHVLLLNMHHVIADGWSLAIMLRDLFEFYQAHRQQRAVNLLPLPLQFSDYACWQRQQDYREALNYWRTQLADLPPLLTLPTDHPRPERQSYAGSTYSCHLPAEISEQLNRFSQQQGVTLFTTLLSCFSVLLARYAGQTKLAIGTPVANRDLPGTDAFVGFMANTLAMRCDLTGEPTFCQLLERTRDTVIKSFAYQDLPFGQLVEELNPQRSLSYSPVFQAMFVLQDAENMALPAVEGLELSLLQFAQNSSGTRFDLTLSLVQSGDGLRGVLEYNCEMFTDTTISLLWQHLQQLMSAMLANPDVSVLSIDFAATELQKAYPDQCVIINPYNNLNCCPIGVPGQLVVGPAGFPVDYKGNQQFAGEWIAAQQGGVVMQKTTLRARRLADGHLQLLGELSGPDDIMLLQTDSAVQPNAEEHSVKPTNNTERLLCDIWQQVLRLPVVGIDDNFFALGGDSILSIQVASKARKHQLKVTVKQLFTYQTIRTLAPYVSVLHPEISWESSEGDCLLLPIQHWLLAKPANSRQHFTQSLLFSVPATFSPHYLPSIVRALLQKHDVLRLKLQGNTAGFVPLSELDPVSCIQFIDISTMTPAERQAEIAVRGEACKANMILTQAPLFRVLFFAAATPQDSQLLLIAHHMVVDGVSWRILASDLQQASMLLSQGLEPQLPASSAPFAQWSSRLHTVVSQGKFYEQEQFWLQQLTAPTETFFNHIPCHLPNLQRYTQTSEFRLTTLQTRKILESAYQAYKLQPDEIMLAAVLIAYQRSCGQHALTVMMESHGRAELFADLDVSDTVGWFTSMYPLHLQLEKNVLSGSQFDVVLNSVKQQLCQIPLCGVGYGCLRELNNSAVATAALSCPVPLLFNYLGNFTTTGEAGSSFAVMAANSGADIGPEFQRDQLVDINCAVVSGELSIHLRYHQELAGSLEVFARILPQVLDELGEYCRQQQYMSCTPADFPLVAIEQAEIDELQRLYPTLTMLYPATAMQQGMMFHSLLDESRQAYSTQLAFSIEGDFQLSMFRQAWSFLLERYEVLRSSLVGQQRAHLLQVVQAEVTLPWQLYDWQTLAANVQQELFTELCETDKRRGFSLSEAPLMRMTVCQLGPQKWNWLWTHHHSILDGWSVSILMAELFACYRQLCNGQQVTSWVSQSWRDYNHWLAAQNTTDAVSFWTKELDGVKPALLSHEHRIATIGSGTAIPAELIHDCSVQQTVAIQQAARFHGVTPSTLLQAAWTYLLSCVTGQSAVIFGQTVSGRIAEVADIESMVGLSIATVPVVAHIQPEQTLTDWLQQLQQQQVVREGFAYLSLTDIFACSDLGNSQTLFDTLLVFENFPLADNTTELEQQTAAQLSVSNIRVSEGTNYPLTLIVGGTTQLRLKFSYQHQHYSAETVQQLMDRLLRIIEAMLTPEAGFVHQLPYLTAAELQQLQQWNDTAQPVKDTVPLHQLFEQQVDQQPSAVALVFGQLTLSYADINTQANRLAHLLIDRGVGAEDRVGILLSRTPAMLIAILAVLKAGGCYVPLDPAYPANRVNYLIEDSAVKHLIREIDGPVFAAMSDIPVIIQLQDPVLTQYPLTNPQRTVYLQQLAYLIYTSGSTGKPKGVAITHQNVVNLLTWAQMSLAPQDIKAVLASTSMCFDLSIYELFLPLVSGNVCVLIDSILNWQQKNSHPGYPVTLINTVPSAAKVLLEQKSIGDAVRVLNLAGEPLKPGLVDALYQHSPVQHVCDLYGPSEYTTYATWTQRYINGPETIGRPLINSQVYLLNSSGQRCAVGQTGEIYLTGDGLARGYLNKAAATAEKFVPNPYASIPGQRIYRTGDLARYLEDGNLQYLGRIDHQIKLRGFRIELGEIETLLLSHPEIKDAVVVASGIAESQARLVAYVVLHHSGVRTSMRDELAAFLAGSLPSYMVPSNIMVLGALPLTPNGKVDRDALPQPLQETGDICIPEGETELKLAALWEELLSVATISRDDSFFRLGGNSVLAMRLIAQISTTFAVDLPMRSVFDHPELKELASLIAYYQFDNFDYTEELDSLNNYLELDI